MKQVILKARLNDRMELEQKLYEIGLKFSPVFWQHDRVFLPRNFRQNSNFPRLTLRTEVKDPKNPASYYLILRRHIEDSGIDISHITEIKDYVEATALAAELGFTPYNEVSRQRRTLEMDSSIHIYLDKVEHLAGFFVKLERTLGDQDRVEPVRDDLEKTFEVLGLDNVVLKSYAELLRK